MLRLLFRHAFFPFLSFVIADFNASNNKYLVEGVRRVLSQATALATATRRLTVIREGKAQERDLVVQADLRPSLRDPAPEGPGADYSSANLGEVEGMMWG